MKVWKFHRLSYCWTLDFLCLWGVEENLSIKVRNFRATANCFLVKENILTTTTPFYPSHKMTLQCRYQSITIRIDRFLKSLVVVLRAEIHFTHKTRLLSSQKQNDAALPNTSSVLIYISLVLFCPWQST